MTEAKRAPAASVAAAISYEDLYARWERGHWLATEIDFSRDRADWHDKLSPDERRAAMWLLSLFFHGEDEVTDQLSPYVDAAPSEEATYFLATQQADEARHSVFFSRFMHEVIGVGDGDVGSALAATSDQLSWGHRALFDHLGRVAGELRRDGSKQCFAEAVTNYMIIVEGTLAQPGQHMLERWLDETGVLPGFREGLRFVARDEQRHIAFGMKALSDLVEEDPSITQVIADSIRAVGFRTLMAAYPDDGDSAILEPLGLSLADLYAEGMRSLDARLRGIGLSPELRQQAISRDPDVSFEDFGRQLLRFVDAGYLGDGSRAKSLEPGDVDAALETVRAVIHAYRPAPGTVIELDLTDVGPRHFVAGAEGVALETGPAGAPTVSLRCSFEDLIDVIGERTSALSLLVRRRLRVSGDRSLLMGERSIFGPPPQTVTRRSPAAKLRLAAPWLRAPLAVPGRLAAAVR